MVFQRDTRTFFPDRPPYISDISGVFSNSSMSPIRLYNGFFQLSSGILCLTT